MALTDPRHEAMREGLIARAVRLRQIAPDRADAYKRLYDADPNGITHLLTAPVDEGGLMAGNAAPLNPLPPQDDSYPRHWVAGSHPTGTVTFEDTQSRTAGVGAALPPREKRSPVGHSNRVTVEP